MKDIYITLLAGNQLSLLQARSSIQSSTGEDFMSVLSPFKVLCICPYLYHSLGSTQWGFCLSDFHVCDRLHWSNACTTPECIWRLIKNSMRLLSPWNFLYELLVVGGDWLFFKKNKQTNEQTKNNNNKTLLCLTFPATLCLGPKVKDRKRLP